MNQTRLESFIETMVNIVIGFTINWFANLVILPAYGYHVTGGEAFSMGLIFTVISIVRSYVLRRFFNNGMHKLVVSFAKRLAS